MDNQGIAHGGFELTSCASRQHPQSKGEVVPFLPAHLPQQIQQQNGGLCTLSNPRSHRPYRCNWPGGAKACKSTFSTPSSLQAHLRSHMGANSPFCCNHPNCFKRYQSAAYLAVHLRTHTGARPFVCHVCNASFREKGCLSRHAKNIHRQHS